MPFLSLRASCRDPCTSGVIPSGHKSMKYSQGRTQCRVLATLHGWIPAFPRAGSLHQGNFGELAG